MKSRQVEESTPRMPGSGAVAGLSTGGRVTREALERGLLGVCAAQVLLWVVAQIECCLREGFNP